MELGFLLLRIVAALLKWLSFPFCLLIRRKDVPKPIPSVDNPLLMCSATKLAELIRDRKVKSVTVINAYIQRIKTVNPIVNGVVEDRFIEAMDEARQIDKYLSESKLSSKELAAKKPLLGVPLTVKESCSVKGLSLVVGSTFMKGTKAIEDGVAVSRLRNAGAIPLLVSTTPELCISIDCNNLVTGKTRNPYNTSRTSGGSSGGEGALIGSASSVVGIGSDVSGSLRIPAMFNSIFAHKPTSRIVSTEGHWPYSNDKNFLNHIVMGPLTRYAEDLKLMMQVLNESDKVNFKRKVELYNMNIFYMEDIGFYVGTPSVQSEIKEVMRQAANYLSKTFHMHIRGEKFNELKSMAGSCFNLLMDMEDRVKVCEDPKNPEDKHTLFEQLWKFLFSKPDILPYTVMADLCVRANCFIPTSHTESHRERVSILKQELTDVLGNDGVFLFPTFPTSAFHHDAIPWNLLSGCAFDLPFNIMGLPSTQVPLGFDAENLPIGIQIIAGPYQDHLCLAVAEALEKHFGGWKPPRKN